MTAWYDVGEWIEVDQKTKDAWDLPHQGPYQVMLVDWAEQLLKVDYGPYGLWVPIKDALPSKKPEPSLAEKERAALEAEGWRRRRDENLAATFRPPPRARTAPEPT